ncbi:MAG: NTP transferase domain-containing protein [Coriobacteriales bacterium]|jgi:CTP:phosphocholine cytidylyltransferase-like protein|nr:NTP transferase domain-containing protein [Coriobacteriales bacterium]
MKDLSRNQFAVLQELARHIRQDEPLSQRQVAQALARSLGTVNRTTSELLKAGYVADGRITPAGLRALEPYRVRRAVFLAAGFGARMVPLTLNTPKPLMRVKGRRIIDTLLDAVLDAGIEEVYIVRGYLSEQFDQLLGKYPQITFIENPLYNESNNITSLYFAREHVHSAYVFEADLLLYNPALIERYQYETNYLGVPVEETGDCCFFTTGRYIDRYAVGGTNCHHMFGISYWSEEDGARLAKRIRRVVEEVPGGRERMWDQVSINEAAGEYRVAVRQCSFDDIIELDTYRELCALDPAYRISSS